MGKAYSWPPTNRVSAAQAVYDLIDRAFSQERQPHWVQLAR
jgi:hypothetical protein